MYTHLKTHNTVRTKYIRFKVASLTRTDSLHFLISEFRMSIVTKLLQFWNIESWEVTKMVHRGLMCPLPSFPHWLDLK